MNNIKILINYHNAHKIIKSKLLVPIQLGRKKATKIFENMIGDDKENNISELHSIYGELTSQYYIWKNYSVIDSPNCVGFTHSKRHFIFSNDQDQRLSSAIDIYGLSTINYSLLNDDYLEKIGFNDLHVCNVMNKTDVCLPKPSNLNFHNCKNPKEYFVKVLKENEDDYDKCMNVIYEMYPEYEDYIIEFNEGSYCYFYNMFIMKKGIFFDYSEFLFSILEQLNIDNSGCTEKEGKILSYLSQFILSIYIIKLRKEKNIVIKEFFTSHVMNSYYEDVVYPAFDNYRNVISCACSNLFSPYFSVYLQSICNHSKQNKLYDIVVLEDDISDLNKQKLLSIINKYKNISLRFFNVDHIFANLNLNLFSKYFSKHCYYRLALGKIFCHFNKVIFTDIDLYLNCDLHELFDIDIRNKAIAACEEIFWNQDIRDVIPIPKYEGMNPNDPSLNRYLKKVIGCTDKYYNTGVVIVDIKKFNQKTSCDDLLKKAIDFTYINQEQCVLNKVFAGDFFTLPLEYNFEIYRGIFNSDLISLRNYMNHLNKAKIYHFLTSYKVWFDPSLPKGEMWWKTARDSPFYEELILRLCESSYKKICRESDSNEISKLRNEFKDIHFPNINNQFAQNEINFVLMHAMKHKNKLITRKVMLKLTKIFCFGNRLKARRAELLRINSLIKQANAFEKNLNSKIYLESM